MGADTAPANTRPARDILNVSPVLLKSGLPRVTHTPVPITFALVMLSPKV